MWRRRRSLQPEQWPEQTTRPRVLIEDPDGATQWVSADYLRRNGFDVATCCGPQSSVRGSCPLVNGAGCPAAAGADLIYSNLEWTDPRSREVLRALRDNFPDTPVVVEIPIGEAQRFADDLEGCDPVYPPAGRNRMLASVRAALMPKRAAAAR